jgi:hypothetical protein
MEKIKHLFSFFLKIAFAIFFIVLVIRIAGVIPRTQDVKGDTSKNASSTPRADILPSPRKYSGFFTNLSATTGPSVYGATLVTPTTFVYDGPIASVGGAANSNTSFIKSPDGYTYNTYDYSAYPTTLDEKGNYVIGSPKTNVQTKSSGTANMDSASDRRLTIRNLSIYQGGQVYTGLAFVGEARSTMFRDGKFPIVVVDGAGRLVGVSTAIAQTQWSVPGWVRFEARINYVLPNNAPCTMIFEEALTSSEQKLRAPNRVSFGVRCN